MKKTLWIVTWAAFALGIAGCYWGSSETPPEDTSAVARSAIPAPGPEEEPPAGPEEEPEEQKVVPAVGRALFRGFLGDVEESEEPDEAPKYKPPQAL